MADVNNRPAARCTILVDEDLYNEAKKRAVDKRQKLYQYINWLIAKDTGSEVPTYLRHRPSSNGAPKTKKQPLQEGSPPFPKKGSSAGVSSVSPVGKEQTL